MEKLKSKLDFRYAISIQSNQISRWSWEKNGEVTWKDQAGATKQGMV